MLGKNGRRRLFIVLRINSDTCMAFFCFLSSKTPACRKHDIVSRQVSKSKKIYDIEKSTKIKTKKMLAGSTSKSINTSSKWGEGGSFAPAK